MVATEQGPLRIVQHGNVALGQDKQTEARNRAQTWTATEATSSQHVPIMQIDDDQHS